jgi:hypothetical protein
MTTYLDAVRAATIKDIPNIAAFNGNASTQVDSISPALKTNERVLVKDQLNPVENGIYEVGSPWKRAKDLPKGPLTSPEIVLRVAEGATYQHTEWFLATKGPINVGTTPLAFAQSVGFRTDEHIYYVSTNANASDSNDGLAPTAAFRTIDRALTALDTSPGIIQLGVGQFDAPAYGIALFARQAIQGAGAQASRIIGLKAKTPLGAIVSLTGARSACRDLWITYVNPEMTGLRVTTIYPLWTASTDYTVGRLVSNFSPDPNDPNLDFQGIYRCVVAGQSAASGGPTGKGLDIVDNQAHWDFVQLAVSTAENVRVENVFVDALQPVPVLNDPNHEHPTIAFGIGDNTSKDVSEVCLVACSSVGNGSSIHMKVGNGTTGNVLDISNYGGGTSGHRYGVRLAGAPLISRGLNFGQSVDADIWLHQAAVGTTSIVGGRSENSNRFLWSELGAIGGAIRIADYTVVALTNTDGQGIKVRNSSITLDNVTLLGRADPKTAIVIPQFVWVDRNVDYPAVVSARNIASEHPHPFQSPWAHPGVIIKSDGTRFVGDQDLTLWKRRNVEHWRRRKIITDTTEPPYSLDPADFEAVDIRLSVNAGSFTLRPGIIGQRVSICFEQDGLGGHEYHWPALCAFSGAAPAVVKNPRNRQTCEFRWTGRFWEQYGAVTMVTPPAIPANGVQDNFSSGNPCWLNTPSPAVPGGPAWEHVPGGGSLGIVGGKCVCPLLGWLGDKDNDLLNGFTGFMAAAAVIETGMTGTATTPVTVSATFTWYANEGVVVNYLDDMTFVIVFLTATQLRMYAFSNGVPLGSLTYIQPLGPAAAVPLVPGSSHTLKVTIYGVSSPTPGYDVTLDDGAITIGNKKIMHLKAGADFPLVGDLTKHGILAGSTSATFSQFSAG